MLTFNEWWESNTDNATASVIEQMAAKDAWEKAQEQLVERWEDKLSQNDPNGPKGELLSGIRTGIRSCIIDIKNNMK